MAADQKLLNEQLLIGLTYTGTFAQGLESGLKTYVASMDTAFKAGQDLVKVATDSMTRNFTDFFDVTSKGFLDFQKLAISVLGDIERQLIKTLISQPLTQGITTGNFSGLLSAFGLSSGIQAVPGISGGLPSSATECRA